MRRSALLLLLMTGACRPAPSTYLYVWAGDSARASSDFLAVIDATPGSPRYGAIVASLPTGDTGTGPHHTEAAMPANGHLLANGFGAGRSYLFDLSQPTTPRLLTAFGDRAGFSHPHTYWRLDDGTVLATFQYAAGNEGPAPDHQHGGARTSAVARGPIQRTGGLVVMDETGTVVRAASARDTAIGDPRIYPYSALPIPALDRVVSTTTNMDEADTIATARWIQLWRLSDLALLRSFALEPGPRGTEHRWSGEPRLLPDGRGVYIHTFMCGLYLVRDVASDTARARLVHTFEGRYCGVPVLTGHYWLATVPQAHALVALDISDPEHPRQVSSVTFPDNEEPHWIAADSAGRRIVLNSSSAKGGNRLYIVDFDPVRGALAIDERFRDAGDSLPGVRLSGRTWPHGFTGSAAPHGTVFSR